MAVNEKNLTLLESMKIARKAGYDHGTMDAYNICERVIRKWCAGNLSNRILLDIVRELTDLVDDNEEEVEGS